MKKITALLIVLLLSVSVSSCASRKNIVPQNTSEQNDTSSIQDGTVSLQNGTLQIQDSTASVNTDPETVTTDVRGYSLEDYDGWWHHLGGTVGGEAVVEVIKVDSKNGTWTEYSKSGIVGGTYSCYVNEMGINLEYGDVGTTVLMYDGVSLLNAIGFIEYVSGDAITEVSPSAYDGKWYLLGDTDAEYIEIGGGEYTIQTDGAVIKSGSWISETERKALDGGSVVDEVRLVLDSADSSVKYIVADKGSVLYSIDENKAYIREEVLDTSKGEDYIKKYDLICHKWQGDGAGSPVLEFGFYENKFYLINTVDLGGEEQTLRETCGTWSIHEYELSLHYADGHEEITPYDPDTIVFSYYNHMSFSKMK